MKIELGKLFGTPRRLRKKYHMEDAWGRRVEPELKYGNIDWMWGLEDDSGDALFSNTDEFDWYATDREIAFEVEGE
jgi:hypothetical protein